MKKKEETNAVMENLISLAKRRGFIFQGSEIYGGLAGTWDYGPHGVALKNNVKALWWKRFVTDREDMYGMDAAILMNQNAWKASGHVSGFSDPLVECRNCKKRSRVDSIVDAKDYAKWGDHFGMIVLDMLKKGDVKEISDQEIEAGFKKNPEMMEMSVAKHKSISLELEARVSGKLLQHFRDFKKYTGNFAKKYLNDKVSCPHCGKKDWNEPRQFNMMFKTHVGATEDDTAVSYLRPETAGGMFVNFKNIIDTFHPKLPFGMAQIGKAFRNEIAPRDFIFRTREFEQMEIEYFVDPKDWEKTFDHFVKEVHAFTKDLGLPAEKVHEYSVPAGDLAHYSKRTTDFEFDYPFGKKELYGLAYRTDFDLKAHAATSNVDLSYFDEEAKTRLVPHVIEPSFGVDRSVLAILTNAYREDELGGEKRTYLALSPNVAPIKVAVFPLLKNKEALTGKAREIYTVLRKQFGAVEYDESGSIGKRYRRQDEIGTPYCVTVDFDTVEKDHNPVTVRTRDTGAQESIPLKDLVSFLVQKLNA